MPVDYRKQYTPSQVEPLWPNALIRGAVAALCTLAVMIVLAVLPVILSYWGVGDWMKELDPADPRVTPEYIRPEWYFLANYQWLKIFPSRVLGIPGETLAVLLQGFALLAILLLPFVARRWASRPPGFVHGLCVTVLIVIYLILTLWAAMPLTPLTMTTVSAVVIIFVLLLLSERRRIRRIMGQSRGAGR